MSRKAFLAGLGVDYCARATPKKRGIRCQPWAACPYCARREAEREAFVREIEAKRLAQTYRDFVMETPTPFYKEIVDLYDRLGLEGALTYVQEVGLGSRYALELRRLPMLRKDVGGSKDPAFLLDP